MTGPQSWLQGWLQVSQYQMELIGVLLLYEVAFLIELMPWRKRQRARRAREATE